MLCCATLSEGGVHRIWIRPAQHQVADQRGSKAEGNLRGRYSLLPILAQRIHDVSSRALSGLQGLYKASCWLMVIRIVTEMISPLTNCLRRLSTL